MTTPHSFVLASGEIVPLEDTVCECGHWYEEHDLEMGADPSEAWCGAPGCECNSCRPSAEASSPEAIADRGGDPDLWPEHVRRALSA